MAVKLPPAEFFGCPQKINDAAIEYHLTTLLNPNNSPYAYAKKEADAMKCLIQLISCREICGNGIDDDGDGWSDCNDPDCAEAGGISLRSGPTCQGQAIFREHPEQKFGFDENAYKLYPTYKTPLGEGISWKSLGVGETDMVIVEFSEGIDISSIQYRTTGVQILSRSPLGENREIIAILGNNLADNASIEVLIADGSAIRGLMVVVLEKRAMVLNLILVKRPEDAAYPNVNFTTAELQTDLNKCFQQINMSWTVEELYKFECDFDSNQTNSLDDFKQIESEGKEAPEYYNVLHVFLLEKEEELYRNKFYPSENPELFKATATLILYHTLESINEMGQIYSPNGSMALNYNYGILDSDRPNNKRTAAHELGHSMGYQHPWEDKRIPGYPNTSIGISGGDPDALMDYLDYIRGYKIRAYLWTK